MYGDFLSSNYFKHQISIRPFLNSVLIELEQASNFIYLFYCLFFIFCLNFDFNKIPCFLHPVYGNSAIMKKIIFSLFIYYR